MTADQASDFLLRMAATGAALITLTTICWFLIGPRIREFVRTTAAGAQAAQRVQHETQHNGGTSVKDYALRGATAAEEALVMASAAKEAADVAKERMGNLHRALGSLVERADSNRNGISRANASIQTLQGVVEETRDAVADHDIKSREAVTLFRAALQEQGIDLPHAPGEDDPAPRKPRIEN